MAVVEDLSSLITCLGETLEDLCVRSLDKRLCRYEGPVFFDGCGKTNLRLDVNLIEAWENIVTEISLEQSLDVLLPVLLVYKSCQTRA